MKYLIISDAWHPQVNGVVRTYEYIMAELLKMGHEVLVIGPADFPRNIPMPDYAEIRLALAPYRLLKKKIEDFRPDHIHIAVEGPLGWAARRYCVKHKRRFTTSYHTQFPEYVAKRVARLAPFLYRSAHSAARYMVRKFHEPACTMMVATQSLQDTLTSWNFKPRICRLTRGVDIALFRPGAKTLFKDLPGPVALYVGRVAIEKNIEDFLDMEWAGSKVIVGDGPELPDMKKRYPQACFAGIQTGKTLAAHYQSADLFVFPSRTDTFGIVLIEALACGLPVAGYDVTGPKDIITEPFLGALHKHDLSKAALLAQKNGNAQQRHDHVCEHYTWEKAARQFIEAFTRA